MYTIKVNSDTEYQIEKMDGKLTINGHAVKADIRKLNQSLHHIIKDSRSYNVEVVSFNTEAKTAEIKINGNTYTVTGKDQYDLLLEKLGMNDLNHTRVSEIKAPMPGLVLKVFTEPGNAVKKGDNLFTLEAMKMENMIKAPADATVKQVKIKPGDKVEKGQVLISF